MIFYYSKSLESSKNITLVIMDGQSNNGGVSFISTMPSRLNFENTNVKIYKNGVFNNLIPGVNNWGYYVTGNGESLTDRWGAEMEFAYLARQNKKRILIIKTGRGSTGLNQTSGIDYNVNSNNEQHDIMIALVNDAINSLESLKYNVKSIVYFFMQGEQDATNLTAANAYENNLNAKFNDIKASYQNIRFVLPQISINGDNTYTEIVRSAQANVAGSRLDTVLIDTDSFSTLGGGDVHFDDDGYISLGASYYNAITDLL